MGLILIQKIFVNLHNYCQKDRYDQIIDGDRDSAKKHFGSLAWDAYDLLKLIVLRLEYLITKIDSTIEFDTKEDIFKRFDRALDFFPAIPKEIIINIVGHNQKIGFFNYILRTSFWRPRDVISNLSHVLALIVLDNAKYDNLIIQNKEPLENEMVKLTIETNARRVIQEELIDEYKNVFRNLESILLNFMDSDLIVNAEQFCYQLSKLHFNASYAYNLDKTGNKLYVLYQLGLIGLYFDRNMAKSLGYLHHICFNFNAGLEPIKNFNRNEDYEKAKAKIIFNPILNEMLSLKVNTNEVLCDWEPDYIIRLHKMKSIIQTI